MATVGDNVVDIYPALGTLFPGGNAVNVAVAARRRGLEAAYVGVVGTDDAGEAVRSALEAEHVRLERLRVKDGPTAYSVIELLDGDRNFVGSDDGVSRFRLTEDDLGYLSGFDCVHTGDTSEIEDQLEALAAAARRLSFDFSDRPLSYCEPLLEKVWLACFSGARLTLAEAEGLAARSLAKGPSAVLVTRGPGGALLYTAAGDKVHVPSAAATPRDTLGAGDAVIGTVLAGLLRDESPEQVMADAMSEAACACADYGAFGYGRPVRG